MRNLKNVLSAVDFSESSANALKEASRIAKWNDANLTVLHVLDSDALEDLRERVELDDAEVMREAEQRLEKFITETLAGEKRAAGEVVVGHPFVEILRAVTKHAADLLVLGSRGSSGDEKKTGVVASKCVRKAPVKVLLVRQRQEGPFRKIVACVDFSETSKKAVEQAVQIALQDKASLHLMYVFQPVPPGLVDVEALAQPINPLMDEDYIPHMKQKLMECVAEYQDELSGVEVVPEIIEEFGIGHGIVDGLTKIGADLVVLGTRGRTGMKVLLMGTTAERVIHDAACSTLAIKPEGFEYQID